MTEPFAARLRRALDARGPLCVGIDPHPSLLRAWGVNDDVAGVERFTRTVVDALAGQVAVLKPQSAFYERFGSAGIGVLERGLGQARDAGALLVLDAKRGDIGSTATAYAQAYLDPGSPLYADAVTATPYLGVEALAPMFEAAARAAGAVFVLALTSNPEGRELQYAVTAAGGTVAGAVVAAAGAANRRLGPGTVGVVVGATVAALPPDVAAGLAGLDGPVLAPGLGAQGATPADLPRVFGAARHRVLPSSSRDILAAGPGAGQLRHAAAVTAEACRAALR